MVLLIVLSSIKRLLALLTVVDRTYWQVRTIHLTPHFLVSNAALAEGEEAVQ